MAICENSNRAEQDPVRRVRRCIHPARLTVAGWQVSQIGARSTVFGKPGGGTIMRARNPAERGGPWRRKGADAMRMFDQKLDLDLAVSRQPVPSVVTRLGKGAVRIVRTWLNRSAVNRLADLDDRQLLDMGLRRQDLRGALTSSFFADPGLHLTIASRERARRHLRTGRTD